MHVSFFPSMSTPQPQQTFYIWSILYVKHYIVPRNKENSHIGATFKGKSEMVRLTLTTKCGNIHNVDCDTIRDITMWKKI